MVKQQTINNNRTREYKNLSKKEGKSKLKKYPRETDEETLLRMIKQEINKK